jgi:hypothetical protein
MKKRFPDISVNCSLFNQNKGPSSFLQMKSDGEFSMPGDIESALSSLESEINKNSVIDSSDGTKLAPPNED